jgi:hypothetical protein
MAIFSPTSLFSSVDLPAFGFPTIAAKPDLNILYHLYPGKRAARLSKKAATRLRIPARISTPTFIWIRSRRRSPFVFQRFPPFSLRVFPRRSARRFAKLISNGFAGGAAETV